MEHTIGTCENMAESQKCYPEGKEPSQSIQAAYFYIKEEQDDHLIYGGIPGKKYKRIFCMMEIFDTLFCLVVTQVHTIVKINELNT